MRKTLLATVAAAAVVGFTTLAVAQTPEGDKGAAKPQGAQQQPKAAPGGAMMHQQGGGQSTEKALDQKGGESVQGESKGAKPDQRLGQGREDRDQTMPDRGTQQKGAREELRTPGANATERNASQAPVSGGASAQLTENQRTKIQGIIGRNNAARVGANVKFKVAVGTTVPRDVHVEALPDDIVEIVPQYEGFDYIVVGDEILIVDPRTLEIVAIIPA
jgi:Protein of unknown function (DUF1236)